MCIQQSYKKSSAALNTPPRQQRVRRNRCPDERNGRLPYKKRAALIHGATLRAQHKHGPHNDALSVFARPKHHHLRHHPSENPHCPRPRGSGRRTADKRSTQQRSARGCTEDDGAGTSADHKGCQSAIVRQQRMTSSATAGLYDKRIGEPNGGRVPLHGYSE